ncbi:hypothetical protein ACVV2G_32005 [Streptomyces ziwulingensis]
MVPAPDRRSAGAPTTAGAAGPVSRRSAGRRQAWAWRDWLLWARAGAWYRANDRTANNRTTGPRTTGPPDHRTTDDRTADDRTVIDRTVIDMLAPDGGEFLSFALVTACRR